MQNNLSSIFKGYQLISGGSSYNDNLGQSPIQSKYIYRFHNEITGRYSYVSDLTVRLNKRNELIDNFYRRYEKPYSENTVSILTFVVKQEYYSTPTVFLNTIIRKLKRKNIKKLGYIWLRDIGEEVFERHYHVIIVFEYIDRDKFIDIFKNKAGNHYNVQFVKKRNGMRNYLKVKGMFGGYKTKSYGSSRSFYLPNPPI